MLRYAVRRIALTIPVLLGVATLVFALIHMVPGDPAEAMLGESAPAADLQDLRSKLGLDQPLLVQYQRYLGGLVSGNLGLSFRYQTPVGKEIGQRIGPTAQLAAAAMVVAILIAIPLGVIAALYRGRAIDHAAMTISLLGVSMPNFWLGPLLAIVLSIQLGWLPVSGSGTPAHFVLPAVTLGAALAAMLARMTRATLVEELRELYVVAARARRRTWTEPGACCPGAGHDRLGWIRASRPRAGAESPRARLCPGRAGVRRASSALARDARAPGHVLCR